MKKELRVMDGKMVHVTICPPSKRRKGLGLTKAKYQAISRGGRAVAKERGLILSKEEK